MKSQPLFRIPMGSRLVLDRRPWLVTGKEEDGYAVENLEDGECITLSFERVDQAIRDGACDVIKPAEDEKLKAVRAYTGGYETFEQLPEEQQKAVRGRLPAVLAIVAMEEEGIKLTHRNMSPNKATRSEGKVLRELKERARIIAKDDPLLGAKRGGRVTVSLDWPQGRTLRKYADTYRRFDRNSVVLLDRDHKKGPREKEDRQRLSYWQERFISYVLNLWHDTKQPPLAPLVRMAMTQFPIPPEEIASGRWYPTITTIRTRKNALSEVVRILGRKGIRQGANLKGAGSTDIPALMFGEKAATDQVYLSIHTDGKGIVRAKEIDPAKATEDLEENEICRLWLHLTIDVATRLPLAWIIAESADADHSHALLRMATRDKMKEKIRYGCKRDPAPPAGLLLMTADNGTATRNGTVYASQLGIDSIVMASRTYHSTDNAFVERPFGTLQWQVLNFLDGYAGSRPGELEGYEPEANARITHDELYGIITRYFVDEYPFAPHRGTGMFGATPWQKFDEVMEFYGGIEVPDRRERCLHLGVKRKMHTTSEGVNPFNIPFNSKALQVFAGGRSRSVTVHIDPDFMRHAYVTAKGHPEIIKVDLRMTAFSDLTLEEILDLQKATAEANPKKRVLNNSHYQEALDRRSRESGFLPDPQAPSSYRTIEQLEKQADRLAQVEVRPAPTAGPTAAPGSITDRSGTSPAHRVAPASAPPPKLPVATKAPPTGTPAFAPIKDSKL